MREERRKKEIGKQLYLPSIIVDTDVNGARGNKINTRLTSVDRLFFLRISPKAVSVLFSHTIHRSVRKKNRIESSPQYLTDLTDFTAALPLYSMHVRK